LNADKETVTLSSEDVAVRPDVSASRLIGDREQDSTSAPLGFRMATLSGKTIGNYQIENELGRGAMGVVYRAKQLSMDRYVALKFLPKRLAQDDRILQRFTRAADCRGAEVRAQPRHSAPRHQA
jgi:serine/threonine protein kinase